MHKKLLLLGMALNCAMIQASEPSVVKKNYDAYRANQAALYHSALINDLSGDDQAIADEDKKNADANQKEEELNKKKQYDGVPGYWSTEPTVQSKTGRKFQKYAQYKEEKNSINDELSQKAQGDKVRFGKEILPIFQRTLEEDRFFIDTYCLPALKDCGTDINCYDLKGLSSKILTNPEFGLQRELLMYACFAKFASERNVQLAPEDMKMIAEHNPTTQEYFNGIQEGLMKMSVVREEILNPKTPEETV